MPNYRRFNPEGRSIFVTFVTHERRRWLQAARRVQLLMDAMRRIKAMYPFRHVAHVIMPDHVHWMFAPIGAASCSAIVAAVKRDVTWRLKGSADSEGPPYWQARFFDHIIRDERDWQRHLDYIHFNPVKHGLTPCAAEHPHSSFREWVVRGVYDQEWGRAEPQSIAGLDLE